MKKKLLTLLLSLLFLLSACQGKPEPEITTTTENQTTSISSTTIMEQITVAPELIQQIEGGYGHSIEKRYCYIANFWEAHDVFPPAAFDMLVDEYGRSLRDHPPEMYFATLIKRYDVPKGKFEEAIQKAAKRYVVEGHNLTQEAWELPNPDILYTFDNEIINAYYRRENLVEPDWATLKTYESYSAFLAANPQ